MDNATFTLPQAITNVRSHACPSVRKGGASTNPRAVGDAAGAATATAAAAGAVGGGGRDDSTLVALLLADPHPHQLPRRCCLRLFFPGSNDAGAGIEG